MAFLLSHMIGVGLPQTNINICFLSNVKFFLIAIYHWIYISYKILINSIPLSLVDHATRVQFLSEYVILTFFSCNINKYHLCFKHFFLFEYKFEIKKKK